MRAVTVPRHGGTEVLAEVEIDPPSPGPGQIRVEVTVAGVNYMDVYQRTGGVPRETPFTLGVEGAGVVTEVGSEVTDLQVGDRVTWFSGGTGSFAEVAVVDSHRAIQIRDDVPDLVAASILMQGITAQYLSTDTYAVKAEDTVLIHAVAGGVGQMLTQFVKLRGGRVIGTASTSAKANAAQAVGADVVLGYEDFAKQVREATDGAGVAAVYDGVGAATFEGSLASLRPRGVLAIYGTASGPTPALEIPRLNVGGSLYVTRPSIAHYTADAGEMYARAADVMELAASGAIKVNIGGEYSFGSVRAAFDQLEGRQTAGKVVVRP
jgi:NADPH:quinone reductase